jgi:hypothetical protein
MNNNVVSPVVFSDEKGNLYWLDYSRPSSMGGFIGSFSKCYVHNGKYYRESCTDGIVFPMRNMTPVV